MENNKWLIDILAIAKNVPGWESLESLHHFKLSQPGGGFSGTTYLVEQ